MAKAKKLPSGSWRIRVFSHSDADGKNHYKSFTASTRAEVNALAAEFEMNKKRIRANKLKIQECIDSYIDIKESVLSPATIRGYRALARNAYKEIGNIYCDTISMVEVQRWVNNLAVGHSPKHIKNAYGLLTASLKLNSPNTRIFATLPRHVPFNGYVPNNDDIQAILAYIRGNGNIGLERAVMLGAFGPLRRGEICALTYGDIEGDVIHVNKDIVRTQTGSWVVKPPKTLTSIRSIQMPHEVIEMLGTGEPDQLIVPVRPDALTMSFARAVKRSGLQHFRFHDLRHYAVSILHAIGIADVYIQERGGWSRTGGNVMRTVYLAALSDESKKANARANKEFNKVIHMTQNMTRNQKEPVNTRV